MTNPNTSCKKNVTSRIFSALLVAMCVAVVFLLKVVTVTGARVGEATLFDTFKNLFSGAPFTLFGIPALADPTYIEGQCATLALYLLTACLVISVILGVIAIFCGKKSPALLRTISFLISLGFLAYAVMAYSWYAILGVKINNAFLFTVAPGAVAALVYIVLAFARAGKKAVASFFHLVLSVAAMCAIIYSLINYPDAFITSASFIKFETLSMVIAGVVGYVLISGALRFQAKKGLVLDMTRYILQIVVAGFTLFVAISYEARELVFLIIAIASTAISVLQLIICILQKHSAKKANAVEEETEELPEPAPTPFEAEEEPVAVCPAFVESGEYVVEEYAEATAYEGGPVEGVEVAKEVNPTFVAPPASVQTAGYDFYNSKSFDPFIAILSQEERNQFTELFILKYKGVMPEIPEYQVGGCNKEFFRKVFIYLGQYRDRIPDSLLAKMYQFAIKMN